MASLKTFKTIALLEATSFLLLLVGSVIKRTADNDLIVKILGPIHGVLFVAYFAIAFSERKRFGWTSRQHLWIQVAAWVPLGGYFVDRWLSKRPAEAQVS